MTAIVAVIISLFTLWGCQVAMPGPTSLSFPELSIDSKIQFTTPNTVKAPDGEFKTTDSTLQLLILKVSARVENETFVVLSDLDVFLGTQRVRFRPVGISFDTVFQLNDNAMNTKFIGQVFRHGSRVEARFAYLLPRDKINDLSVFVAKPLPTPLILGPGVPDNKPVPVLVRRKVAHV